MAGAHGIRLNTNPMEERLVMTVNTNENAAVDSVRDEKPAVGTNRKRLTALLWVLQGLLALIFLFAGSMKFIMPIEMMTKQTHLPGPFFWFIGVCEVLGALGLILPGLLHNRPHLTPLAAAGLAIIMIGATVVTLAIGQGAGALAPFVVGLLCAFVAYGRSRLAPLA
jgi:uncharacterized membrane protein YphA (DoxX/SURF4 family)